MFCQTAVFVTFNKVIIKILNGFLASLFRKKLVPVPVGNVIKLPFSDCAVCRIRILLKKLLEIIFKDSRCQWHRGVGIVKLSIRLCPRNRNNTVYHNNLYKSNYFSLVLLILNISFLIVCVVGCDCSVFSVVFRAAAPGGPPPPSHQEGNILRLAPLGLCAG